MDSLKKCASILTKAGIKANRSPKLNLDIFPVPTQSANTAPQPQLDAFDAAVNRALTGERVHVTKPTYTQPTAKRTLTFDEKLAERLG